MKLAVIVKKFRVRAGGKTYFPGEVISGLDKKEEKMLVDAGYCDYPTVITKKTNASSEKVLESETVEPEDIAEDESEDGPDTSHPLSKPKSKGKK
jgi:uncharacterized protein related to proFAR isomerase